MRICDLLDELRRSLPGCSLCAYIDLDVQLVLSVSSADRQRQEQLDELARLASRVFTAVEHASPGGGSGAELPVASVLTGQYTHVFLQAPSGPGEAICCRCAPDVNTMSVVSDAKLAFTRTGDAA